LLYWQWHIFIQDLTKIDSRDLLDDYCCSEQLASALALVVLVFRDIESLSAISTINYLFEHLRGALGSA
jgi:hypothetical protein